MYLPYSLQSMQQFYRAMSVVDGRGGRYFKRGQKKRRKDARRNKRT